MPADQVGKVTTPRDDVTITRDKKTGVPHIKGTTRYGTEYGAGYAAGQDRLWLMDLFRHIGRGELTSFAGGALANQGLEQQFWPQAPYTEDDLKAQVERIRDANGERGKLAMQDAQAYVDGINAYREQSKNGRYFPGEYVLTGHVDAITNAGEIQPFTLTDLIALASVVGGLFGNGGGGEVPSALALLSAQQKYGVEKGTEIWESFRERNDPEAAKTLHDGSSFPYAVKPAKAKGMALPDPGSVTPNPWSSTAPARPPPRAGRRPGTRSRHPRSTRSWRASSRTGCCPRAASTPPSTAGCPTPCWSPASTPRAATRSPCSARRPATSRPSC